MGAPSSLSVPVGSEVISIACRVSPVSTSENWKFAAANVLMGGGWKVYDTAPSRAKWDQRGRWSLPADPTGGLSLTFLTACQSP